jgi:hypothetical protein
MSRGTRKILLLALMLASLPLWTWLRHMPYRYVVVIFP